MDIALFLFLYKTFVCVCGLPLSYAYDWELGRMKYGFELGFSGQLYYKLYHMCVYQKLRTLEHLV